MWTIDVWWTSVADCAFWRCQLFTSSRKSRISTEWNFPINCLRSRCCVPFYLSQFYINSKVQPDIDNSSCRMVRCALKSVHSFHHLQFTWLKVTSQTRIQQFNRRLIKKIVRFLVCFHKYHTNKITNVVTITFKISLIKSTKFATVIQEKSIFFVRHNFTV